MCGVNEAMAVLSIVKAVGDFQGAKAQAKSDKASNAITEQNTNMSYMNDIQKIEGERIEAAREMSLSDFGRKMELRKQQELDLMSPNSIINQPKPTPTSDWGIVADWEKENL